MPARSIYTYFLTLADGEVVEVNPKIRMIGPTFGQLERRGVSQIIEIGPKGKFRVVRDGNRFQRVALTKATRLDQIFN